MNAWVSDVRQCLIELPRNRQRVKREARSAAWIIARYMLLIGFSFVILYPVIIIATKGFMTREDLYDPAVILVPKHPSVLYFSVAADMIDYLRYMIPSLLYAISVALLQVFSCMLVGYGFARFRFRLNKPLFVLVILTMLVPPQLTMISQFIQFRYFDVLGLFKLITGEALNLYDTVAPFYLLAATCMGIKNGLMIYMFRQTFMNIPKELHEAAEIDGARSFTIFGRVMAPCVTNTTVTMLLFGFVWQFYDTTYAGNFLKNSKLLSMRYNLLSSYVTYNLPTGLTTVDVADPYVMSAIRGAGVVLMLLPVVLVYLVMQKKLIQGIERSGLVG